MSLCTERNVQALARIVFGEARGEPDRGKLAVACSVVNRVHNPDFYPNTLDGVMYEQYNDGSGRHHYNTLDDRHHDSEWDRAKRNNASDYQACVKAARDALSGRVSDPTNGAVCFASVDPHSATSDTPYSRATHKQKIGGHWFVRRERR